MRGAWARDAYAGSVRCGIAGQPNAGHVGNQVFGGIATTRRRHPRSPDDGPRHDRHRDPGNESGRFRLRDQADGVQFAFAGAVAADRLRYAKQCPTHGPVEAAAIVRGYEYGPGQHVRVEPEELDQLRPAQDRALRLERFLAPAQLDPVLHARRRLDLVSCRPAAEPGYA